MKYESINEMTLQDTISRLLITNKETVDLNAKTDLGRFSCYRLKEIQVKTRKIIFSASFLKS